MKKIDDIEWQVREDQNGNVSLVLRYADGKTETIHVAGLPDDRSERMEMVYRSAQSMILHRRGLHVAPSGLLLRDKTTKIEVRAEHTVAPPQVAELIIACLAPKNSAQAQLGDLQEMFEKNAARLGERQARRKYWMQVASSLLPLLLQWAKRIGFFTVLIGYFRSKFGL